MSRFVASARFGQNHPKRDLVGRHGDLHVAFILARSPAAVGTRCTLCESLL